MRLPRWGNWLCDGALLLVVPPLSFLRAAFWKPETSCLASLHLLWPLLSVCVCVCRGERNIISGRDEPSPSALIIFFWVAVGIGAREREEKGVIQCWRGPEASFELAAV